MQRNPQPSGLTAWLMATMLLIGGIPALAHEDHHDDAEAHETAEDQEAHQDHEDHDDHDDHDDHLAVSEHLRVLHGWTRATDHDHARVFMEIENIGDEPVRITGGRSTVGEHTALVGFSLDGGEGRYQPLDAVPVMPGRMLELAPRALALDVDGLNRPLVEGASFPLVLTTDHGDIEMSIAVEAADADQHSHAGHAH
jgi:copper(I)-binding protein